MKLFVNPHTGAVMDWDAIPATDTGKGPAKFCPTTGKPLNHAALAITAYPGPAEDAEKWRADQAKLMDAIASDVAQPNADSLGIALPAAAPAV